MLLVYNVAIGRGSAVELAPDVSAASFCACLCARCGAQQIAPDSVRLPSGATLRVVCQEAEQLSLGEYAAAALASHSAGDAATVIR